MTTDHPDKQHERLWAIAGDWATTGQVVGDPPVPVSGSDIYQVLRGGFFLVHHVDVTVGSHEVRAIEMIGARPPAAAPSWRGHTTTKATPSSWS